MYHLRLIKGLSYSGAVSASKEHPDVFTDSEEKYSRAMESGYFEDLSDDGVDADVAASDTVDEYVEDEDVSYSEEKFSDMSVDNLKNYAVLNGIDLGSAKRKDEIIKKIEEAEAHAAEVRASMR